MQKATETQVQVSDELKSLLKNVEENEIPSSSERIATPKDMSVELMEHQRIGVEWMLKKENGMTKGGILADDMGLGKTIQTIATIVSNRERSSGTTGGTLLVVPASLIIQWEDEIFEKTMLGSVSVHVYHGSNRVKTKNELGSYDVVITTYGIMASEWPVVKKKKKATMKRNGALEAERGESEEEEEIEDEVDLRRRAGLMFKMEWHRIVLDEAHNIKNRSTAWAKSSFHLRGHFRWCLTGTPIQNSVRDLFSLICFLDIAPFNDWTEFRRKIEGPFKRGLNRRVLERIGTILKAICLRRNKQATLDGKAIVNLPSREVSFVSAEFSEDEKALYTAIEKQQKLEFNKYIRAGTVMSNYPAILLMLLRLRQACCHPKLMENSFHDIVDQKIDELSEPIVTRLKNIDINTETCPICCDMITDGVFISKCGHLYCRKCISWYFGRGIKPCPICKTNCSTKDLISTSSFSIWNVRRTTASSTQISSAKIDRAMGLLNETRSNSPGDKTVVFSQFTGMLDLVEEALVSQGFKYVRFDGSMSIKAKTESLDKFSEDSSVSVMLVSLKCGSVGLNMTCANRVIMLDVWWNPAIENQAIDRVHRLGQMKNVVVNRVIVAGTIEDRILDLQAKKQDVINNVFGEGEGTCKMGSLKPSLSLGDLIYLFGVDQE